MREGSIFVLKTIFSPKYALLCFLNVSALFVGSCNNAAGNLALELNVADGNTLPDFDTIKIIVRSDSCDVRVFQVGRDESSIWLPTTVEPGQEFYVDVWACSPSNDFCEIDEIVGRGCTPIKTIAREGSLEQAIEIYGLDDPRYSECPPDSSGFSVDQGVACDGIGNADQ